MHQLRNVYELIIKLSENYNRNSNNNKTFIPNVGINIKLRKHLHKPEVKLIAINNVFELLNL